MRLKIFLATTVLAFFIFSCKKEVPVAQQTTTQSIPVISFTLPADSVILDPYGVAPLSALINFTSPVKGSTLIVVKGKNGPLSDIQHQFQDSGFSHSVQVIGLYAGYANTVNVYVMSAQGDTLAKSSATITTNPLPANFTPLTIQLDVPMGSTTNPGINLVSNYASSYPQIPYMVDNFGDIRWLLNYINHPPLDSLEYECGINRLRDGNFFFGDAHTNAIYEIDPLGKIINTWPLLQGYIFHHHLIEIPNGNFITTASLPGSTHPDGSLTGLDYVIEINRQTGGVMNVWDLKVSLDEFRTALTTNTEDWFHGNALLYDSTDNTIIVSGRTQCVVKLDFGNNVKWILSNHKGWGTNRLGQDLNQFLLKPLDSAGNIISDTNVVNGYTNATSFEWNWFQHSPVFMPNRDIMLFDDGTTRNFDTSSTQPKYSRAVEYKIDPVNMTVQQIWEYGKERGIETYSAVISNVQYLPATDHVLFCPGYQVVNTTGQGGKIVEIDYATRQVVSEISESCVNLWGFHRAYRMNPYPN
jgi:arylsulfate sulfotransferase